MSYISNLIRSDQLNEKNKLNKRPINAIKEKKENLHQKHQIVLKYDWNFVYHILTGHR